MQATTSVGPASDESTTAPGHETSSVASGAPTNQASEATTIVRDSDRRNSERQSQTTGRSTWAVVSDWCRTVESGITARRVTFVAVALATAVESMERNHNIAMTVGLTAGVPTAAMILQDTLAGLRRAVSQWALSAAL